MFDSTSLGNALSSGLGSVPGLYEILVALLAAFVFSQILAWTYQRTHQGLSYATGVSQTLILSSVAATMLIIAMQYSLVAGLGLLAALSMVRFRTTFRSPRDLVFLMASVTIGVACGSGALLPALVGTLTLSLITAYLAVADFGRTQRFDGVLRFRVAAQQPTSKGLSAILERYCSK
ncbi:MAG: DUF4956 domain-containing protein, partial [Myxococcales bacterium]|nr:DUF4956 domain-containing protein [Myxococcales bacterium]